MSTSSPTKSARGRSVVQYEITSTGGVGRKIAEYSSITAASAASKISYHVIRGILGGKTPKPGQYHWKELETRSSITPISPSTLLPREAPPLPSHRPDSLSFTPPSHLLSNSSTSRSYSANSPSNNICYASSVTPMITIHSLNTTPHHRSVSLGSAEKPKKKDTIPSLMRTQVWNRWIGIEKGQVRCPYCQINYITPFSFECGHVLAEAKGGEVSVENLRAICSECNRKMSTQPIDLNRYRLLPGIAGQINPQNKQPYPTTIDGQRAFIEAHTLTNLHGKVGEALRPLKYDETEVLAKTRWRNWVEVYEMCAPQPVLVTDKSMHLHPYNEQLAAKMKIDSCRSTLSKAFQKLGI